jgi:hypothetical protein
MVMIHRIRLIPIGMIAADAVLRSGMRDLLNDLRSWIPCLLCQRVCGPGKQHVGHFGIIEKPDGRELFALCDLCTDHHTPQWLVHRAFVTLRRSQPDVEWIMLSEGGRA